MPVSRVDYGSRTLIDLTGCTVVPDTLLTGITAVNAAGEPIIGTYDPNLSTIIVTAPTGSTVTCTKSGTTLTASEQSGAWWFRGITTGTWTITATKSGKTATKTVSVTQFDVYRVAVQYRVIPEFTYSGTYKLTNDSDSVISDPDSYTGNWRLHLLTSGTLKITDLCGCSSVDAFLVGGGGGSAGGTNGWPNETPGYGAGGYHTTAKAVSISATSYTITIGAGGTAGKHGGSSYGSAGGAGGTTSALGKTATGGGGGIPRYSNSAPSNGTGGAQCYAFDGSSGTIYAQSNVAPVANRGYGASAKANSAGTAGSSGIVILRNKR